MGIQHQYNGMVLLLKGMYKFIKSFDCITARAKGVTREYI
jgi:hypothetical protein